MKLLLTAVALMLLQSSTPEKPRLTTTPKIQAAILLDVSSSMEGLIDQAKAQLWNMVNVMGKAECNGVVPSIEIALYEYGRSSNEHAKGFVQQLTSFTTDLDSLSTILFSLRTNGGSEYCGQVIYSSLKELKWDADPSSYKVIFIAGNEDFLQGTVTWQAACAAAAKQGVIVNTIYCGDRMQGIREHWNLGSECGTGSYTHINQDAVMEDIATPYDSALFTLNQQLNGTYLSYGTKGLYKKQQQAMADEANFVQNKAAAAQRVTVKGKKELYRNSDWDLVDAYQQDSTIIARLSQESLDQALQGKAPGVLVETIKANAAQRSSIQKEITELSIKRETYLVEYKRTNRNAAQAPTLETEIEKIIREQAKRFNMEIKQ